MGRAFHPLALVRRNGELRRAHGPAGSGPGGQKAAKRARACQVAAEAAPPLPPGAEPPSRPCLDQTQASGPSPRAVPGTRRYGQREAWI